MPWLLVVLMLCWTTPAFACFGVPGGPWPVRTFGPDAYVPGNQVFFQVLEEPITLSLSSADGTPIPASIRTMGRDRVFAPEVPIPPRTHVLLRWSLALPQQDTQTGLYAFRTVDSSNAVVDPDQPIALQVSERGLRDTQLLIGGGPQNYIRVSVPNVSHLLETTALVDGRRISAAFDLWNTVTISSSCQDSQYVLDSCNQVHQTPLGKHTVQVSYHLVGSARDPAPSLLEVTTSCTDLAYLGIFDAGTPAPPTSVLADATIPWEASVPAGSQPSLAGEGGCHVADGPLDAAWPLVALAFLARRTRRQASRTELGATFT